MPTEQEQKNTLSEFSKKKAQDIKEANGYLMPKTDWKDFKKKGDDIYKLAKSFQNKSAFSYARRLFQLLYNGIEMVDGGIETEDDITITEKQNKFQSLHKEFKIIDLIERLAICTYKDTDLSSESKYDIAIKIVEEYLNHSKKDIHHANFYGLLGSIYKKKWQYENDDRNLYDSLHYYQIGYAIAKKGLMPKRRRIIGPIIAPKLEGKAVSFLGYCGINTVYVFELLDHNNSQRKGRSREFSSSSHYKSKAKKAREELLKDYKPYQELYEKEWNAPLGEQESDFEELRKYWFFITLAEANLGNGDIESAENYYEKSLSFYSKKSPTPESPPEWARHAASVQGFNLLELLYKNDETKKARSQATIGILLKSVKGIPTIHNEKIGLALSGGGFRASMFHIGVLAQLAEKGILHKVETISCVSGGSIIGAMYYLKLKKLLENKIDISQEDYIHLIVELEKEFTTAVRKNIRLQILSNFQKNLEMASSKEFNRTSYIAELYDEHFYNDILEKKSYIKMQDLKIHPIYEEDGNSSKNNDFNPKTDNWKRKYKVPTLVINATTLNTGHCWQFTATWMGESPSYINSEFDALPTLRRMYYDEAGEYENIRLSTAVAASAGVPGIFAPVELNNLYEDHEKVLLVDGGVHDNQGLTALYEEECNVLIISDASGQMPEEDTPSRIFYNVLSRSNSILQNRVRDVQFKDLQSRKRSGIIRDYLLIHFTKDLYGNIINWKECNNRLIQPKVHGQTSTKKNDIDQIKEDIQYALAKIRTDLDSFHDSETYGLMYRGYKITEKEVENSSLQPIENNTAKNQSIQRLKYHWNINKVEEVNNKQLLGELKKTLDHSSSTFGKLLLLKHGKDKTKNLFRVLLILILGLPLLMITIFFKAFRTLAVILDMVMLAYIFRDPIIKGFRIAFGVMAWGLFNLLQCFNKSYLSKGELPNKKPRN